MPAKNSTHCDKGYCVKCKKSGDMVKCNKATSKNGRNMLKGECNKCGTKMCKFVK